MALKRYSCQAVPNLRIGAHIKFNQGFFSTDKEYLQKTIESNDLWGCRIIEIPNVEEVQAPDIPQMKADVDKIMEGLGEEPVDEVYDVWADLTEWEDEPEEEEKQKPINELTATDINRMRVDDLDVLASEIGAELEDPEAARTKARLARAVRLKLGL